MQLPYCEYSCSWKKFYLRHLINSAFTHSMCPWQLKGWYNKDDVVAEWKKVKETMFLNVHCYVSGPNILLDLAAEFRYNIFSKELPLVSLPPSNQKRIRLQDD